ncbi:hypothetical protein V8C86DRAFT_2709110, partial [Haematococcus lacustris]
LTIVLLASWLLTTRCTCLALVHQCLRFIAENRCEETGREASCDAGCDAGCEAGCETGCEAGCEENGCEVGCEVRSSHRAASQVCFCVAGPALCGREVDCRVCGCEYGLDVAASMGNLVRCHRCNTGYTMLRLSVGRMP